MRGKNVWNRWARGGYKQEMLKKRRDEIARSGAKNCLKAWEEFFEIRVGAMLKKERDDILHDIKKHCGDSAKIPDPWEEIDFSSTNWEIENLYLSFVDFIFPTETNFSNTRFSGGTVSFKHARFYGNGRSANFANTYFSGGSVSFEQACFYGGSANFANAHFSESITQFENTRFPGGTVSFENVRFSGSITNFHNAKFSGGPTIFQNAHFLGKTTSFAHARFLKGIANFRNTKFFGKFINFGQTKFLGGDAEFQEAHFSGGSAGFGGAQFFGGNADFEKAQFSGGYADFQRVVFKKKALFIRVTFKYGAVFEKTEFRCVPDFRGVDIDGIFNFIDTKWPKIHKDDDAAKIALAYSQLKRRMDELKLHDWELEFHAKELDAKRRDKRKPWHKHVILCLYGRFSGYGLSVFRPTLSLVALIALAWPLYYVTLQSTWPPIRENDRYVIYQAYMDDHSRYLAFRNTFPFIPKDNKLAEAWIKSKGPLCQGNDTCLSRFSFLQLIHTMLSLVLIFLIGLALRNKLRLR